MPRPKAVVLALVPLQESRNPALLAKGPKAVVAAGQKLVYISLVAHVPHNLVFGGVVDIVEGDRQLHYTKARGQVTAMLGYLPDNSFPHLGGQAIKFFHRTVLYVLGGLYVFKFHHLTRVIMNAAMARRMLVSQERLSSTRIDCSYSSRAFSLDFSSPTTEG